MSSGINSRFVFTDKDLSTPKNTPKKLVSRPHFSNNFFKDVNILMAIQWAQEAWKEVTGTTIKNCFARCGVSKSNDDFDGSSGR